MEILLRTIEMEQQRQALGGPDGVAPVGGADGGVDASNLLQAFGDFLGGSLDDLNNVAARSANLKQGEAILKIFRAYVAGLRSMHDYRMRSPDTGRTVSRPPPHAAP